MLYVVAFLILMVAELFQFGRSVEHQAQSSPRLCMNLFKLQQVRLRDLFGMFFSHTGILCIRFPTGYNVRDLINEDIC